MFFKIIVILCFNKLVIACDIFIASKCPMFPATNDFNVNSTLYCKNIKDHVDCINKKLKNCKNVQEFGPALETIKLNLKVLLTQVSCVFVIKVPKSINSFRLRELIMVVQI
jgi:hypothetical protein